MVTSAGLLQFLLLMFAGWLQRQQATAIEYLKAENRMLRERLGGRRIIFTDAERRQLAEKARAVGRKGLRELGTIVTPETLLRWHREPVARKWTFLERRRPGRPRTREELAALVVRMATENRSWGYTRLQGAMANLGHKLGRGTIRGILKDHGIEPAPERGKGMPWAVFLKAHWKVLAASDFFTVEVWSWRGLITRYVLFVIELATRRVRIAGISLQPDAGWMIQMGRNLLDVFDGPLIDKRYLIVDRDTKYCAEFSAAARARGHPGDPAATALTRPECVRGKVGTQRTRGMPLEVDSARAGDAAARATRIRRPFSLRAKPSGSRQCADRAARLP